MKRPSFQFYPADWRNNAKLRRCSEAARGAWMDILCALHDADEYGVLRWPLVDIARAAGIPLKLAKELVAKDVLKGADDGPVEYTWAPTHAGKTGDLRTLLSSESGPCWYSSRLVRDEHIRSMRGASTRFTATEDKGEADPKPVPKPAPKPPIGGAIGGDFGDGPSSASSSSEQEPEQTLPTTSGAEAPPDPPADAPKVADPIWHTGLAFLERKGIPAKQARAFLGKLKQQAGDIDAAALLAQAEEHDITDPIPWLSKSAITIRARRSTTKPSVAERFGGKTYAGSEDHELPEHLRPHAA